VKGFCPSFVWVEGGGIRKADGGALDLGQLAAGIPLPRPATLDQPVNLLIAGIGGLGVTTTAAVLAMAAHLDGVNASTLDMTGLAQKGGPVTSHVRFSRKDEAIEGPRVPAASLDVLLASDMLVAAGADVLSLMNPARTATLANGRVAPTVEFTLHQTLSFNEAKLAATLREASREIAVLDLAGIAEKLLGDSIFTNMLTVGMAFQKGLLPMTLDAIENAIRLNRAAVDKNLKAFHAGRVLAVSPEKIVALMPAAKKVGDMSLDERITFLAAELDRYQDTAYGDRYRAVMARVAKADRAIGPSMRLTATVAESLYSVMAVKDEYEVARLYADPAFKEALAEQFEAPEKIKLVLSPPVLSGRDANGRPKKRAFGPWIFTALKVLAAMKRVRGTWLDPFAFLAERKAERRLRADYLADLDRLLADLRTATYGLACEIAKVPQMVRGYGPVKEANMAKAMKRRAALIAQLDRPEPDAPMVPIVDAAE